MTHKILLVDDEQNILDGLKRILRKEFSIEVACGGEIALKMMETAGPFAVVVSDMRMPGMNGVQLLKIIRERAPDVVRLMLTGNSEIQTAISAVNEGSVFRFLAKPCSEEVLKGALTAALAQYDLITAEKEILEKTLRGSVKVLTDILALVNPAAFSRTSRVLHTMQHVVQQLGLHDIWRYDLAAMLSQIGCVALDTDTVEAMYSGAQLPVAEQERFKMHPSIAYDLLSKIPRLELVAQMVGGQQEGHAHGQPRAAESDPKDPAELGARLLKVAVEFDQLLLRGAARKQAIAKLKSKSPEYDEAAVCALETLPEEVVPMVVQELSIRELATGMILDQDLRTPNGLLMVARNQEISYPLLVRIRNISQRTPIASKIRVKVPHRSGSPTPELKKSEELQPAP